MSDSPKKKPPLNVVLYWHMHQPEYRDMRNGEYHLPWTYLHSIKDYVDMAAHLEDSPGARAVVNFAPILLEQIDDYARQLDGYLRHGLGLRDPLLLALADPVVSQCPERRMEITRACLRANKHRLIDRFGEFKVLAKMAEGLLHEPERVVYYSEQYFADLLVWYHLAWMAETSRRKDPRITALMKKANNYNLHDRHLLIEIISELIGGLIGRYKKLAQAGVIELSISPYAHPILPLLLDLTSSKQAIPDVELPLASEYPGGLERSRWHMQKGIETFKKYFGMAPNGCWPSEGSISNESIDLIAETGIKWLASGETVLRNSLHKSATKVGRCLHEAYQFRDNDVACFFRDDGLSDLIGFKYSDWHADDAVANLVHHLEEIAAACAEKDHAVVSIILDGENAWEYYPENGFHFISALYKKLAQHEGINLTTYSQYLEKHNARVVLQDVVAGSWVYGTLSTWIGEKDKNRAWDMLVEAKQVFDRVKGEGALSGDELLNAEQQLATCESSDWFWWFGEYNSAESVATFDEQFRMHLSNLYQLLKVEAPDYLAKAFSFGAGEPVMGGAMLPGKKQ